MVATVSKPQLQLDFDAQITEQFKTLKDVVAAVVYGYRGGLGAVAAACDVAPSTLSLMLNENEDYKRHLPLDFLPTIIKVTGDLRPLQWLAAKFIPDDKTRRDAAVAGLEALLPQLASLLASAKSGAE